MTHDVKVVPPYWEDVDSGRKSFEVRKDDRGYVVGDTLVLHEWDGNGYTGRRCVRSDTYVLQGGQWGLQAGYCCMGLAPVVGAAPLSAREEYVFAENMAGMTGH
jgi:hypothetical protein